MPFGKVGLAAAMMVSMTAGASIAYAQTPPTLTPAQALAAQIEADLAALSAANGGMPTDAQIQLVIATDLAMSTATVGDKEAAMTLVQAAASAPGSALPPGTASDAGVAYAALTTTGTFVAAAPGGGAAGGTNGGSGFGSTGSSGGSGGGSSYSS